MEMSSSDSKKKKRKKKQRKTLTNESKYSQQNPLIGIPLAVCNNIVNGTLKHFSVKLYKVLEKCFECMSWLLSCKGSKDAKLSRITQSAFTTQTA